MTTSEVLYLGALDTEAIHTKSATTIRTDAPTDNNGLGRTFSPTDLLATSLASCMLTIMGIRAKESDLDISGTKASVVKVMESDPRRVSEVHVDITVADRGISTSQKKALEKAARNCPVANSLSKSLKQVVRFRYELN